MKEGRGEEPVKLIGPLRVEKRDHSADVVQTFDLGAQRGLFVEVAVNEVAVLLGRDSAHSVDADAAGMSDDFADHVLRHLVLVSTHSVAWRIFAAALSTEENVVSVCQIPRYSHLIAIYLKR